MVMESPEDGLKLLFDGTSPRIDIVAVHGLGGHRENSWTADDGTNWLQSLLPRDLPDCRILSWGYNASTAPNHEKQPLQEMSEKLVLDLYNMRELTRTQNRPIIFMAHSLGGILVKSALIFSDQEQEVASSRLGIISTSTRGVFFMDTTELGISTNGMEKFLRSFEGSEQEDSDSFKEAKWLLAILNQYVSLSAKYRNVYVSPRQSQGAIRKSETDPSSSQLNSSYIVIDADHNTINKFKSPDDAGYLKIKAELLDILEMSSSSVRHISWEE
ncbi:hypothetical protein N7494_004467 [Penicillium frequentans]|uniref:DUF676 domain-containing protein n=1 Tax=Penicillium frequentans TaxID=3151616 RepID=A0AAD6GHB5_9EURO|nr:hypothetical protein N7494_004467 [Penicillium glabrum]